MWDKRDEYERGRNEQTLLCLFLKTENISNGREREKRGGINKTHINMVHAIFYSRMKSMCICFGYNEGRSERIGNTLLV